jgi:hypothetical protein
MGATITAVCAVAWAIMGFVRPESDVINRIAETHRFPPSFVDSRWVYALALFGLMTITLLAIKTLWEDMRFMRAMRDGWREQPAAVASFVEGLYLLTIVLGFGPDTVVLLAWGDQAAPSASFLAELDRALDFICLVPFCSAFVLRARIRPIALHLLMAKSEDPDDDPLYLRPTWRALYPQLSLLGLIAALSMGVAFAK